MNALPRDARTPNLILSDIQILCRWCGDDGYVTVQARPMEWNGIGPRRRGLIEEVGPCPYCLRGYREEFPEPNQKNKHPTAPPWGEDGFWKGRETDSLIPKYKGDLKFVSAPPWVVRWLKARAAGDERPFPEQADILDERPAEPFSDRKAWVQETEYA